MMRIYDWAKGKTGGFLPKDVARVFGMDPRQVSAELRELCYAHKIERRNRAPQASVFQAFPLFRCFAARGACFDGAGAEAGVFPVDTLARRPRHVTIRQSDIG